MAKDTQNNMLATITDPDTKKEMINIKALPTDIAKRVNDLSNRLLNQFQTLSKSRLDIGKTLLEAKQMLEPMGIFVAWINGIPGLSKASAYRYIDRYQVAVKHLPEPVREYALTAGEDIVGTDENKPFGKFTEAVEKVGPPPQATGNKKEDSLAAMRWVNEVTTTQGKIFHKNTRGKKTYEEHVKAAVKGFIGHYVGVDDKQQMPFVRDVFGYILANLSLPEMDVRPKTPSAEFKFDAKKSEKGRPKGKKSKSAKAGE